MADGIVQVSPNSTGPKIDNSELTVGANTVERQRVNISDPTAANALLLKQSAAEQNSSGFPYSAGVAAYASQIMLKDHLVANGPDGTLGSFDTARVDALIALAAPIFAAQGKPIKAGLKATDIVTNQFIDPSIKLPA